MRNVFVIATALIVVLQEAAFSQREQSIVREFYMAGTTGDVAGSWKLIDDNQETSPRIKRSPNGKRLLGPYHAHHTMRMSLTGIPSHSVMRIRIGWHIIGPWQGRDASDRFLVSADGRYVVNGLFSNTASYQTWPDTSNVRSLPSRTRARNVNMLGYECTYGPDYTGPMDATYETEITIQHNKPTAEIDVSAILGDSVVDDCSKRWGIDHIEVDVLDYTPESQLPHPTTRKPPIDAASYDGPDIRSVAEYTHEGHFPGIASNSALARALHIPFVRAECNRCGDACLWYTYTLYTDGWINVWQNRAPVGAATVSFQLNTNELNDLFDVILDAVREAPAPSYHDAEYEEAHIDLTHCTLMVNMHGVTHETEVWAGEPPAIRKLLRTMLAVLEQRGWAPMPP